MTLTADAILDLYFEWYPWERELVAYSGPWRLTADLTETSEVKAQYANGPVQATGIYVKAQTIGARYMVKVGERTGDDPDSPDDITRTYQFRRAALSAEFI